MEHPNSTELKIQCSDIPSGSFGYHPHLTLEEYEAIVDENSWEYLDGFLIHHSPESNTHNAILNFLNYRAMDTLNAAHYIIRTSRIALSIGDEKPEPDVMIFDKDDFRKKKRLDGSESEIIESAPLLVIEIVSKISSEIDKLKEEKYLSKGIREYWQIFSAKSPLEVTVCYQKEGKYESRLYQKGEIRSRVIPDFAITIDEIQYPDLTR
jgi:Uma2 family endonuclease